MSLSTRQLVRYTARLAADPGLWADHVVSDQSSRAYAQIADEPEVNAWVICWSHDHDTGWHDHDRSVAGIVVVRGRVREERLRLGAAPISRTVGPGQTLIVPASAIHRVLHATGRPAVTIHAYSPPLTRTGAYVGLGQRRAAARLAALRAGAAGRSRPGVRAGPA